MPVMEISVVPVGSGVSLSRYVSECVNIIRRTKNIKFDITAMGTIVEADNLEVLFSLVKKIHKRIFGLGVLRIVTNISIDDRRDKQLTIKGKLRSLNKRLEAGN